MIDFDNNDELEMDNENITTVKVTDDLELEINYTSGLNHPLFTRLYRKFQKNAAKIEFLQSIKNAKDEDMANTGFELLNSIEALLELLLDEEYKKLDDYLSNSNEGDNKMVEIFQKVVESIPKG